MSEDNGRVAVKYADSYCSPKCGFGCKSVAHERATKEARDLANRMGDGWEPVVWENCGWNYMARKGCVTIHVDKRGSSISGEWEIKGYSAWVEPQIQIGYAAIQFIENAKTPEDALGFATQSARTHMTRLNQALADIID